ncbi:MAG: hypothetical protein KAH57_05705 [Thermoplasmata archaeon]|nr:hypothetical protein [Thermoplasmata archaeon]
MRFVLYQQDSCPFCKHFIRLYKKKFPDGEIITLKDYEDPLWVEKHISFVPTVIAYDDNGREIDRIGAVKMVGIRKGPWQAWLTEMGHP